MSEQPLTPQEEQEIAAALLAEQETLREQVKGVDRRTLTGEQLKVHMDIMRRVGLLTIEIRKLRENTLKIRLRDTVRLRAGDAKFEAGPTKLDGKIEWLSLVIEVLQEFGEYDDVRRLDETLAKLVETRTKVNVLLESKLTTETIWTKLKEIVANAPIDDTGRDFILGAAAAWFNGMTEAVTKA